MIDNFVKLLIDYGIIGIIIAAFLEPILMPFPVEFVFIPVSLINPSNSLFYSVVLVLFSTFGSIIGYNVGVKAGRPILKKAVSEKTIDKIEDLYKKNAFLTILTSVFTPIPFEAYVLSAGIFKIDIVKFILAILLSRGIRYITQGVLISFFGKDMLFMMKNYLWIVGLVIFTGIIIFNKTNIFNSKKKLYKEEN